MVGPAGEKDLSAGLDALALVGHAGNALRAAIPVFIAQLHDGLSFAIDMPLPAPLWPAAMGSTTA